MPARDPRTIRLGSRKSKLALWQTNLVAEKLRQHHPDHTVEVVTMDTLGDKILDKPLPKIGAKGLFTQELEEALHADAIDLAVHSLKDLPTALPEGLKYAGSLERAAPTDALVSPTWSGIDALPEGAVIATGSVRRRAQLWAARPDLRFESLRGNIDTRLRKLEEHGWAGIIMATAALHRMGRAELVACELDPARFVPAVGQGAIGLESRAGRDDVDALLAPLLHDETVAAVEAERLFMRRLEGGCSVALGAHCYPDSSSSKDLWVFRGWVGSQDGRSVLAEIDRGEDPMAMADAMVEDFLRRGAREILGRHVD